ncbi:MAG TPA: aspartate carbamoyltransferase regulatory subunit [Candidatus Thermoplasmatota archaeon]|nr:aspartate carbamoyltransferase regulatory subunit [Candidatus Thermoplasmatota archaeon]
MKELKIQPIRNGTVIDHITPGTAIKVLRILNIPRAGATSAVTAAMNVTSSVNVHKRKDIVKIEDRELDPHELDKIALISPEATVNIIREYDVAAKHRVRVPEIVTGIVKCPNPNCVSNHEPVRSAFRTVRDQPPALRCQYCERLVEEVADHLLP